MNVEDLDTFGQNYQIKLSLKGEKERLVSVQTSIRHITQVVLKFYVMEYFFNLS